MTDTTSSSPVAAQDEEVPLIRGFSDKAAVYHGKLPYLRKLPFNAVAIIALLVLVNMFVWAAVGVVLVSRRKLGSATQ